MTRPPIAPRVLEGLIERALSTEAMTGVHWDAVGSGLLRTGARTTRPYLPAITYRLIRELLISDGQGWLNRSTATQRLLHNETTESAVVSACATAVKDPANQVFNEPMLVLEAARSRPAARAVLASIVKPVNELARQAAWWSAAEKITRGHFSLADKMTLTREAADLLTQEPLAPARMAAADLLRRTPQVRAGLRTAITRVLDGDELVTVVFSTGWTSRRHQPLITAITEAIAASVPGHQPGGDLMLAYLLEEMLLHPHITRRAVAARMIAATPYRASAGHAVTRELRTALERNEILVATHMIQALTALGDADGQELVRALILDPATAAPVRSIATWSVSHIPSTAQVPRTFWTAMAATLTSPPGDQDSRAIVYAAGIAGQQALLHAVRDNPAAHPTARVAASWWLNHPHEIRPSSW